MSVFKLNIDEDLLLIRTKPGLLNYLIFFRHWSYGIELPTNRISQVKVQRRTGVPTLIVTKTGKDGRDQHFAISLLKASKKELNFITHALPKIISDKLSMPEINKLKEQYLD